jgi:hypothetical protein
VVPVVQSAALAIDLPLELRWAGPQERWLGPLLRNIAASVAGAWSAGSGDPRQPPASAGLCILSACRYLYPADMALHDTQKVLAAFSRSSTTANVRGPRFE